MKATTKYSKTVYCKQVLDFHRTSKIYPDIWT
jgi:hypothetical protein